MAECGSGKTLIALGSMLVHSAGRPFSGPVICSSHLVEKWARETFLTLPQVRVFLSSTTCAMAATRKRRMASTKSACGAVKSCAKGCTHRWLNCGVWGGKGGEGLCPGTTIFCIGREKAKLSYFWKHRYGKSRSGRYLGSLTNPDTGCPVETDGVRLSALDFEKKRLHQIVEDSKAGQDQVLCALASRRQQDRAHGTGGIHGTLHAGMVGLRNCR